MSETSARRPGLIGALSRLWKRSAVLPEPADERISIFLAALQDISTKMKAEMPLPNLVAALAEQSCRAIGADVSLIRLVDREERGLIVQGVHGVAVHRVAGLLGSFSTVTEVFRSLWPGSLAAFDLRAGAPPLLTSAEYTELGELGAMHLLVLPLHHRGRLVGRLDLGRNLDVPFSVDDRAAATVLAGLLASAISEVAGHSERERFEVLEASFSFQKSVEPLSSVGETLQNVVESMRGLIGCDHCYGLLWQEPKREYTPMAVSGADSQLIDVLKTVVFSPAVIPALAEAISNPDPIAVPHAERSNLLPAAVARVLGIRTAVVVGLRGRQGRTLGVLLLDYTRSEGMFSERDLSIIGNVAGQASVILENAVLYEDVKRSSDSLRLVNEIGIELASLTDITNLFTLVHHHVSSVIEAPRFLIGLLLPDEQTLEYRYVVGPRVAEEPMVLPVGDGPLSFVVREQRRILVNARHPKDTTDWFPPASDVPPAESMMAVPLLVGHRVIGVMSTQSDARGVYAAHQLELLATIGMQTAVAIENARLYAMVQQRGELRGYLLDQMLSRQEAERKMLVDDIHNDTLQALATCLFRIELTSRRVTQIPPEETQKELLDVRDNLAENIDRLRHLIFQIRPSTLDILGLGPALQEYFAQLEKDTGIRTTLDVELEQRLSSDLETGIYRIIQEAIDHVRVRNGVTRIVIRIRQRHDKVVVTIADDGHALESSGLNEGTLVRTATISDAKVSLLTLKERAELAGGQIRMASRTGGGATIQILLPLRSA